MSILPPKKPLLKRKLPLNPQPPLAGQKARKRRSALPLPLLNRRQIFSTARRQLQPRLLPRSPHLADKVLNQLHAPLRPDLRNRHARLPWHNPPRGPQPHRPRGLPPPPKGTKALPPSVLITNALITS